MLSEKFTPRASTSERSKRLRASSLSKCRRTSPLSRTSLSGLGWLSSSSEGDGEEVRTVAVCRFDKYSSSLVQSVSHLVRRHVINEFWSFIYLWRLILVQQNISLCSRRTSNLVQNIPDQASPHTFYFGPLAHQP